MAEFNLAASVPRSRYRARWLTVTLSRLSRALEKRTEPLLSLLATPVLFLPLKTILTARTAEKSQFHSAAVTFCAVLWGCRVPSWHVICNLASPGEAFTGEKSGSWCLTPRGYIKLLLCAERTEYSMGWKKDTEEGECILGGMEKKKKKKQEPLEMEVPWTGTRSGERANYCWLSSSGSGSEGVLYAMNQICSGVFGSYCMAIINRVEIRKNLCQGSAPWCPQVPIRKKIKHFNAHYPLHSLQKKKKKRIEIPSCMVFISSYRDIPVSNLLHCCRNIKKKKKNTFFM